MNSETSVKTAEYSSVKGCALALFGLGFALGYFLCMGSGISAFTYFPQTMEIKLGVVKMPESGPGMLWYGWIVYSAFAGLLLSSLALLPAIQTKPGFSRLATVAAAGALIISVVLVWFYRKDFM